MTKDNNRRLSRDPKTGRWVVGISGNPNGRPRGAKDKKTILTEIANKRHRVKEAGGVRTRTTVELLFLTLRNLALEGNIKAVNECERLDARYNPSREENTRYGYLIVPEQKTLETTEFPVEIVEDDE